MRSRYQGFVCKLEDGEGLLSGHGREVLQGPVRCVAAFQPVENALKGPLPADLLAEAKRRLDAAAIVEPIAAQQGVRA